VTGGRWYLAIGRQRLVCQWHESPIP
jgi:hypothetical protein